MELEDALLQLLNNVGPVTRRLALREIAGYLMRSNRKRILANVQPGGTGMMPRQGRGGRMFRKIGGLMQQKVTADQAETGFYGRTAWVASNHQMGRMIRKGKALIDFPVRLLLGLDDADRAGVGEILLKHLGKGLPA